MSKHLVSIENKPACGQEIPKQVRNDSKENGFTLIEIVVVLAILSVLIGVVITGLNPSAQLEKARDATRLHDLSQIKVALDTYYNDKKCYPVKSSFFFGSPFKSADGATLYMQKVPQDPTRGGRAYTYQTKEGDTCPQWNVLYAALEKPDLQKNICPLSKLTSKCVPSDFSSSWACQVSGDVDCAYLAANSTGPTLPPASLPTPTPTGVSLSPTPTPDPNASVYNITSSLTPTFTQVSISPQNVAVGGSQQMSVKVVDPVAIKSVSVKVRTDTKTNTYPLTRVDQVYDSGNGYWKETWSGTYTIYDTHNTTYMETLIATDNANQTATDDLAFK